MTNEDFLKEALASPACPDEFETKYINFCKYQKIVLNTLKEFARVCEKNNISYQLAYGSLLGAVRDNGQIPWDYDIDIIIPFYERKELLRALEKDLDEGYYYLAAGHTEHYSQYFIRVIPNGYPHEMLHIDVYYALGIPDEEPERTSYINEARNKYNARRYTMLNLNDNPFTIQGKIKRRIYKVYFVMKYGRHIQDDLDILFEKYDIRQTKDAITVTMRIGKFIFPSRVFLNTTPIETRAGTFNIPVDYDSFLNCRYGDWKKYLPIEDRIAEVMKHCNHFRWYKERGMVPSDAPDI